MHVSLDSALGRQRRLNSVGESVLQIAPNAAAAYSLRSLTGGDPKVVRVRRDTDNAEQDFTASGVSSGALVDFATSGNGVFANTGYESFTNASASGFTASNTGSTGFAVSDILDGVSGDSVSVSFDIDITNGSPGISLRTALNGGSTASNGIVYTTSGSKTATLTGNKGYVGVGFTEGDAPSNFTVSNFKVLGNGFVETWYDQSGNSNDAVQATAGSQPKIVNSGTLLNELDFDGTNDTFSIDFGADLSQASSIFMVHQSDTTTATSNEFFDSASGANPRTLLDQSGTDYRIFSTGASVGTGVAMTTDKSLIFALYNGTSSLFAKNGTPTSALNAGTTDINQNSVLGSSGARFYNGSMQEVIIYNSDQSSNRVALETNINSHYSIF